MAKRPRPVLGEHVRRLRQARNWTQAKLAEKANISIETLSRLEPAWAGLSRLERGVVTPSTETLAEVAAALDIEVEELAGLLYEDEASTSSPSAESETAAPSKSSKSEAMTPSTVRAPTGPTDGSISAQIGELARVRRWGVAAVGLADRSQAAVALREFDAAQQHLAALAQQVDDPHVLLAQAEVTYRRGDYTSARSFARAAVDRDPGLLDAWIIGFRTSLASGDKTETHRWLDALRRLYGRHPRVLRAEAQLAWEEGEVGSLRAALAQLPDEAVFARSADADLRRLLRAGSVVIGDGRVSVLIGVFQGQGIRSVCIFWRDDNSALPEPKLTTRWRPATAAAREALNLEPLEGDEEVGMKGVRVVGMEEPPTRGQPVLVGMLEVRAEFEGVHAVEDHAYGGLFLIDIDKQLVHQPRRLWAHEIRGIPCDDWHDLPRSQGATAWSSGPGESEGPTAPIVFIAYAREDQAQVEWLDRALREHGLQVWRDQRSLRGGDTWTERVSEAIECSDFVVLCLSKASLSKRGHVQVELRGVLAESERGPLGEAYIIPVRLEEVAPPRVLRHIHHVDLFPDRQVGADQVARHIASHWQTRSSDQGG